VPLAHNLFSEYVPPELKVIVTGSSVAALSVLIVAFIHKSVYVLGIEVKEIVAAPPDPTTTADPI
jgi:hypothetical protein